MRERIQPTELADTLDGLLKTYLHVSFEKRQEGLEAGAEVLVRALETVTPRDTGEMASGWRVKTNYKDRRYVGNTRTAKGTVHRKRKNGTRGDGRTGVPLSNVLEYAENSPHQGFIRRCFADNEQKIYEAIKQKMK